MRSLKAFAAAILGVTTAPFAIAHFSKVVPEGIPSVQGWERITGDLEFESPRVAVQYEFYINPARPAAYEVVRYRVTDLGPGREDEPRSSTTEKLQWDLNGRDVRRFECLNDAAGGAGCDWQEMEKGGADYLREVPVLLWLYGTHNRVMKDRARGPQARHLAAPPQRVLVTSPPAG